MKTRLTFLFVFLSIFLLTPLAISKKFAAQSPPHDTFSFDGSTTSTSSHLPGMTGQAEYWEVTGSASISGTATELGQDRVYKCELWLMVTGDLVSSPFPDKGNIAAEAESDGSGAKRKVVPKQDAKILYLSHPVGSIVPGEVNVYDSQVQRTLSESLSSETYSKRSYTSPTGLCASPEVHGDLSGTLMNFSGSQDVPPLSFRSKDNKACASSPDDGTEVIADEKCKRGSECGKLGTATAWDSHRVECPEERWIWEGIEVFGHRLLEKKQDCEVVWWTCDDQADVCDYTASHVPESEKSLTSKFVNSEGQTVDPNTVTRPCGHLLSASGDHSLQASCSVDDNCIATSFYLCQHETHTYPAQSVGDTCIGCGQTIASATALERWHIQKQCATNGSACGGLYWYCNSTDYTHHRAPSQCTVCRHYFADCADHSCSTSASPPSNNDDSSDDTATTPPSTSTPPANNNNGNDNNAGTPSNNNGNTNTNPGNTNTNNNDDAPTAPTNPTPPVEVSYHPCGVHPTTDDGDHTLQASCSINRQCTATGFYQCQHTTHTFPAVSLRPCGHPTTAIGSHSWVTNCAYYNSDGDRCTNSSGYYRCTPHTHTYPDQSTPTIACPANSWTNCGGTTSHAATCTAGDSYYTCASLAWHQDRTCTRCSQTYQDCQNSASACQGSHWHTETPQPTLVACGAASWTGCTSQLTSSTEHQVTCTGGHSYWTCGTAVAWHQDRTCTRCSQTYQNCQNSATACQGARWHTDS